MSVKLTEDDYHVDQFNKGWAGSVLSEEDIKACTKKPNFSKPLDSFIAGRRKKDKDQLLQLEQSTISQMMVCMKKKYTNRDYDKCQPLKKLNRFLPMDKEKLLIKSWVNCLGV